MTDNILPHNHGNTQSLNLHNFPAPEDFQDISVLLRQLGDGSRLRLFWILCHCEECVINLSAMMNMSSPALSHHLRRLRSANLIVSRRQGKEVYYSAADNEKTCLLHHFIEELVSISCPAPAVQEQNEKNRKEGTYE